MTNISLDGSKLSEWRNRPGLSNTNLLELFWSVADAFSKALNISIGFVRLRCAILSSLLLKSSEYKLGVKKFGYHLYFFLVYV